MSPKGRYVRAKSVSRRDRDWYKKHEHLSADELRQARTKRQQKELDQFAVKQAASLLKQDERLNRTLGRQQKDLLAEIEKKRREITAKRSSGGSIKDRARDIFRKAVDNLTLQPLMRNRAIKVMQGSADNLGELMEKWRQEKRDQLGRQWLGMEKRHAAERERDEQRIARKESKGRTEATGERGKKQFNIRGDAKTARHTTAAPPVASLKDTHSRASKAKPPLAAKATKAASKPAQHPVSKVAAGSKISGKGIFSMIAQGIGSIASDLIKAGSGKKPPNANKSGGNP
jgi:hypothetical protein